MTTPPTFEETTRLRVRRQVRICWALAFFALGCAAFAGWCLGLARGWW